MPNDNITIQEAELEDAQQLRQFLQKISQETDFITETENISQATEHEIADFIFNQSQEISSICLLLKVEEEIAGLVNITAGSLPSNAHIGELFIAVSKKYQGFGLGSELMTLAMEWAEQTPELLKIAFEVQVRNEVALKLYQGFDFDIEGRRKMGIQSKDGELLDVYLMGKCLTNNK
ncbi:GNAT family N-acetyltransferase [Streptococcus iniae]|uniref:GNAT family N-acetyltransferase n=1 Tax=Streptococcus iniae TaxID=1346 RepID=UPI00202E6F82|nr:GNAT family protein [Streptococcus iniae]MCM0722641.1 GNAT family N-acetyltransferase [Streptococcus iniae]